MTVGIYQADGRLKTYNVASVATGAGTDIVTGTQNGKERVLEILVSNVTASAKTFDAYLYRAKTATAHSIITGYSLAANSHWRCDFPMQLEAGDKIKIVAGTAASLDCLVTVSESAGRGAQ